MRKATRRRNDRAAQRQQRAVADLGKRLFGWGGTEIAQVDGGRGGAEGCGIEAGVGLGRTRPVPRDSFVYVELTVTLAFPNDVQQPCTPSGLNAYLSMEL